MLAYVRIEIEDRNDLSAYIQAHPLGTSDTSKQRQAGCLSCNHTVLPCPEPSAHQCAPTSPVPLMSLPLQFDQSLSEIENALDAKKGDKITTHSLVSPVLALSPITGWSPLKPRVHSSTLRNPSRRIVLSVMPTMRHPVAPRSPNEMCVAGAPRTPLAGSSPTSQSSLTYLPETESKVVLYQKYAHKAT